MKPICKEIYKNSRFNNQEIIELIFYSFSKDIGIRVNITYNPLTPPYILDKLSNDKDATVRFCVAQNCRAFISTLEKLSKDRDNWVYSCAINNPTYIKYKKENGL